MRGSLQGTEDVYWYTSSSHLEAALPTVGRYRWFAFGKQLRGKPKAGFEPATPALRIQKNAWFPRFSLD
jgi:hypothetical protein